MLIGLFVSLYLLNLLTADLGSTSFDDAVWSLFAVISLFSVGIGACLLDTEPFTILSSVLLISLLSFGGIGGTCCFVLFISLSFCDTVTCSLSVSGLSWSFDFTTGVGGFGAIFVFGLFLESVAGFDKF